MALDLTAARFMGGTATKRDHVTVTAFLQNNARDPVLAYDLRPQPII